MVIVPLKVHYKSTQEPSNPRVMERFTVVKTTRVVSHSEAQATLVSHLPNFFMTTSEPNQETVSPESLLSESAIADAQVEKATAVTYAEEIETVIASMAVDQKVMVGQNEAGGHLWKFKYGSVEVLVKLTGETEDDTLSVWAFVLQLPAKNEAQLMRKLLEMNWLATLESHFAIVDSQVAVLSTRTIAEISTGEISRAITIVATIADDNDDLLQAEYGL